MSLLSLSPLPLPKSLCLNLQVAHGDSGLTYKYSGTTVPALPWTPLLTGIRERVQEVTGVTFNFVLINR